MRKILAVMLAAIMAGVVLAGSRDVSAGGGCHGSILKDANGTAVDLKGSCFWPTLVRVEAGEQITWTNRDATAHTVTGVANSWGTYDPLSQGDAVSYKFDKSGVFPYFCMLHPSMVGAVVVGDGRAVLSAGVGGGVKAVSARVAAAGADSSQSVSPADEGGSKLPLVAGVALIAAILGFGGGRLLRRRA